MLFLSTAGRFFDEALSREVRNFRHCTTVDATIMRVIVGHHTAHCEKCGCAEFDALAASPSPTLRCARCGTPTTRIVLLMQIAEQAVKEARAFVESSRRRRLSQKQR